LFAACRFVMTSDRFNLLCTLGLWHLKWVTRKKRSVVTQINVDVFSWQQLRVAVPASGFSDTSAFRVGVGTWLSGTGISVNHLLN
jgi:hypothetical protein